MSSSEYVIRSYQSADHDGVVALWNAVFPDEPPWNEPNQLITRKLAVQPNLLVICSSGTNIVGAIVAGFDGVRGWIHHLAVHPNSRRQGIATQLMRAAEHGLKELGCPKVNLQVRAANTEVINFYRANGYAVEERTSLGRRLV